MDGEWELSKENAMPLKRGRDPKKIRAFGGQLDISSRKDKLEEEKEHFEDALVQATSDGDMADPLSVWIKYVKWTQDNHTSGSNELLDLLERCTREFKDDERYRNHEKYLKVWIAYADMLDDPSKVFKFLRENKIGEKLALYYVATAWTAERRNDFPLADKAYSVGIEKKAEPLELLQKRHREFQRRMSRRWLDQAEKERNGEIDPEQQAQQEAQAAKQRSLRPISRAQAGSMHRPVGAVAARTASQSANTGRAHPGLQSQTRSDENVDTGFRVFAEEKPPAARQDDWGDSDRSDRPSTAWKVLPGEREQQKENARDPGPWTDQGFGKPSGSNAAAGRAQPTRGVAAGAEQPSAFPVFVDAEQPPVSDAASVKTSDEGAKLKQRPKASKTEIESLLKKPLQHFDKSKDEKPTTRPAPVAQPGAPSPAAPSPAKNTKMSLKQADDEDVTINTKMALEDMFDMFGSPSMKDSGSGQQSVAALDARFAPEPSAGDESLLDGRSEHEQDHKEQGEPVTKPFSIFADAGTSSSSSSSSSAASKPFSIFGDEQPPAVAKAPSRKPFSLFQDDEQSNDAENDRQAANSSKPFSIFSADSDKTRDNKAKEKTSFGLQGLSLSSSDEGPTGGVDPAAGDEGFNTLECILEASGEIDDSVNSSASGDITNMQGSTFSIFQD